MEEEMDSIRMNEMWKLIQLPHENKKIDTKWVYEIKHNSDRRIERYKTILVANGFTQRYVIYYEENLEIVERQETVRMLISSLAKKK